MAQPDNQPKPQPISDPNVFAQALTTICGRAYEGMGREQAFSIVFKFFVRRALRNLEAKTGGPVSDEDERAEMISHLEEAFQEALDEFESVYFGDDDSVA